MVVVRSSRIVSWQFRRMGCNVSEFARFLLGSGGRWLVFFVVVDLVCSFHVSTEEILADEGSGREGAETACEGTNACVTQLVTLALILPQEPSRTTRTC